MAGSDGITLLWMGATNTNLRSGHNSAWTTVDYSQVMTDNGGTVLFHLIPQQVEMYLNGELVDTATNTTTFTGSTAVRISAYGAASNTFNGKISSVNIYNRAYSAEVLQNFNAQKSRFGL